MIVALFSILVVITFFVAIFMTFSPKESKWATSRFGMVIRFLGRVALAVSQKVAGQREWFLLPLFCAGVLLAVKLSFFLTGRAPIDDPGELVAACYVAVKLAIAVALTGYVQDHHFGYRSKGDNPKLRDDIYDACVTFGLLLLFVWALWH